MVNQIIKTLIALLALVHAYSAHALSLNGFTEFSSTLDINARTQGIVQAIRVKPGQRIKKGEVLIELDGVAQQASLDRARAKARALLPAVETTELELERAFELFDRDSLSQVELKKAQINLAMAQGNYQAAQADTRLAQYQLDNSILRSPINGRVLQLHAHVGQYLNPAVTQTPLITLVDTLSMKAVAWINSEQWTPDLLDQQASVKYRDQSFSGRVSHVGYKRIKQPGGTAAYKLHVQFTTDTLIPADMPVTINIRD